MLAKMFKRSVQKTETMRLVGLQGPESVTALDQVLSVLPGVADVAISLDDEKATITYDTAQIGVPQLQSAIEAAGYEALKPVHGEDGNCCGGCS